ncbi:MAG TPA: bifunctional riboflavin kinase/FAD synthetase [Planctomycetaceae bacterium]|nr:riboflavin biosynthesis protein RibF [Blastopirellula sp.]HAY79732.1 bifunctional riboflavin kinase/FAD synthetase [Planctomycetaceae bacterium]
MQLFRKLEDIPAGFTAGAVSIGNFDGVHRGHARIIEQLQRRAIEANGPAVVFTFDPHPVRLLRPEAAPPPLTWTQRKASLLAELGVNVVVAYPTDETLLSLSPDEFFARIVLKSLNARAVVEGPNFFFGKDRGGDVGTLRRLCETADIHCDVVEPIKVEGAFISSSRIRNLLKEGLVAAAATMLTQPYRIRGMVTHGAARGAKLGFPTANIAAVDTLLPLRGVYAGRAYIDDRAWPAAIHIGPNPTFQEEGLKVEAHVIGFDGSLYDRPLEVDFLDRLRDIHAFESTAELTAQLTNDIAQARQICGA